MGYTGGTTKDPTYHDIGDHTESFQVDFDPAVIPYDQLLEIFWSEHNPTSPRWSTQYATVAFWADEEQRAAIAASRRTLQSELGAERQVTTKVVPLDRFYLAEDYHQKYYLRSTRKLMAEVGPRYATDAAFRDSTLAARVNGFIDGSDGFSADLAAEIDSYDLSPEGAAELLRLAGKSSTGGACAI